VLYASTFHEHLASQSRQAEAIDDPDCEDVKDDLIERMWRHVIALRDPAAQNISVWARGRRPSLEERRMLRRDRVE